MYGVRKRGKSSLALAWTFACALLVVNQWRYWSSDPSLDTYTAVVSHLRIRPGAVRPYFGKTRVPDVPMYMINVNQTKRRRIYMNDLFGHVTTIEAVTPPVLGEYLYHPIHSFNFVRGNVTQAFLLKRLYKTWYPGELSLVMSHLKTVRQAYINGDKYCIILEDDASDQVGKAFQQPHYIRKLIAYMNDRDPNWRLVSLQWMSRTHSRYDPNFTILNGSRVFKNTGITPYGTTAVLYSRAGLQNLYSRFWNESVQRFSCAKPCVADHFLYAQAKPHYYQTTPIAAVTRFTESPTMPIRGSTSNFGQNSYNHLPKYAHAFHWNAFVHDKSPSYYPWNVPNPKCNIEITKKNGSEVLSRFKRKAMPVNNGTHASKAAAPK